MNAKLILKSLYSRLAGRSAARSNETPGLVVGQNTQLLGTVSIRQQGGNIQIGSDCMIEGALGTECADSRLTVGNEVYIGRSTIVSVSSVLIEDYVLISSDCLIQDSDNHSLKFSLRKNDCRDWKRDRFHNWSVTPSSPIRIKRGAWVGAKAIILKGVTIGEGAVVGAGSVVTKDVAPFTVVAGNPARFLKAIDDPCGRALLEES